MHLFSCWLVCVVLCVPALNHEAGHFARGLNVGGGAAGCSIDERKSLRPLGTAWNLFASGAMGCRPMSWGAVACIRFSRRAMRAQMKQLPQARKVPWKNNLRIDQGKRMSQAKRQGARPENRTAHTVPDMITKYPAASKGQSVIT